MRWGSSLSRSPLLLVVGFVALGISRAASAQERSSALSVTVASQDTGRP